MYSCDPLASTNTHTHTHTLTQRTEVKGDVHTDAPAVTAKLTQMVASRVEMRVVYVCVEVWPCVTGGSFVTEG